MAKSFFDELAGLPGNSTRFTVVIEGREVSGRLDGIRTSGTTLPDYVRPRLVKLTFDGECTAVKEKCGNKAVPGKMLAPHIVAAEKAAASGQP